MVTVSANEEGYTLINYAEGKRPLKIVTYHINDEVYDGYFSEIVRFVQAEANAPSHVIQMEESKFFALAERLATVFCKAYAPTRNAGITKPEIRAAILFVLYAGIEAGHYSDKFTMTNTTLVRLGGDYNASR
ncbi:hypothetical protein [Paenibacillus sp. Leaf72]|uniref:hypothetical protein n=1 Tax=Paenibacillus sp. Leaf72 TaxID=1736234 RepID=UPI0006FABEBA|nr:hypothetical protein [Paenibacillus sp. Leaf72]KQN97592.1 hypothetical protein ASF12_20480 [Paenibacillus sp. Leaf72]